MTKEEMVAFLRENLTISISRDHSYYSYPTLTVEIQIEGETIACDSCTIYDGDSND